jgi:hypothetical protein
MRNNSAKPVFSLGVGHHRFDPAPNPELSENVRQVISHREGAQVEFRTDFFVGEPSGQQMQDCSFAFAQRGLRLGAGPFGTRGFGTGHHLSVSFDLGMIFSINNNCVNRLF